MKMVKSLLLGSAAGLVAVTAGQAADLPVKAKPVEYVKVCSLYGAGFYYMPGTDMCIKIGGWVRAEATYGGNGSMTWGPFNANLNQRGTSNLIFRARGYITADAREQTAYGTARAYIAVGINTNDTGLQVANLVDSANRAFVQFAGITAGLAQSFYDFYSAPAVLYRAGYLPSSDTGDGGWWVWGYTAQLGNGVAATISMEARRTTQIIDQTAGNSVNGTIVPGAYTSSTSGGAAAVAPGAGAYGGQQWGDVVGNLRVDQAWGGAQIMGAVHNVNATYYSTAVGGAPTVTSGGHPGDTIGWAAGAGLRLNFPMVAQGDYFQAQVNFSEGALRYLNHGENTNYGDLKNNTEVYGVMSDAVYGGCVVAGAGCAAGSASSLHLTTGWGINASFEHYWTPQWHESFVGGYTAVRYDSSANAMLCTEAGFATGAAAQGSLAVAGPGCNNNWDMWGAGSRLQWDVTKSFYLGVEALYTHMDSAKTGSATGAIGGYTFGSAAFQNGHEDNWAFTARIHKDFLP